MWIRSKSCWGIALKVKCTQNYLTTLSLLDVLCQYYCLISSVSAAPWSCAKVTLLQMSILMQRKELKYDLAQRVRSPIILTDLRAGSLAGPPCDWLRGDGFSPHQLSTLMAPSRLDTWPPKRAHLPYMHFSAGLTIGSTPWTPHQLG